MEGHHLGPYVVSLEGRPFPTDKSKTLPHSSVEDGRQGSSVGAAVLYLESLCVSGYTLSTIPLVNRTKRVLLSCMSYTLEVTILFLLDRWVLFNQLYTVVTTRYK